MFFSVITKNLNWEILIKNLVTFKRWDGIHWQIWFLGGGLFSWELLQKGDGGGYFADLSRAW